ncbi:hypothetical protein GCM10022631_27020 [Deinococcus rubellus]|uniref:MBL fold metallo-hydrolase n=1 Tax=Deinococcus rubellus TaxID=1889240 RepID=A0ABY5YHR5_9DEIO|nr:hypothetical protein [Deinococcus rubellus]UWX64655.1 hypothetical protein N0D28_03045 [Deinococcus rubellus]
MALGWNAATGEVVAPASPADSAIWHAPAYPVPAALAVIGGVLLGFGAAWGAGVLLRAAGERHVPVREVRRGDSMQAGEAHFTVLWPVGQPFSKADNDNSVVVRLDTPRFHTVFLGDLPDPIEGELGVGQLDVLKTAHHGSRFSTGEAFLQETRPKNAVISVGRNTYGHPNAQVLDWLAAAGVQVWRTDQVGTVHWPLP